MRRLAFTTACACLLLSACASDPYDYRDYPGRPYPDRGYPGGPMPPVVPSPGTQPPAHPMARTATYVCEDGSRVVVTEGQPAAIATLNSGMELRLARQPEPGGFRYGVPPYEFRGAGSEGVLRSDRVALRCRVR